MIVEENHRKTSNASFVEFENTINIELNKFINTQKICKNQIKCDV